MLTRIHMVVYTWWCWHIFKGEEVGVDVDQLSEGTKARVQNSTSGASTRRVRTVRRCHRRPIQKRQGLIEWTGCWSRGDRMLGSYVRSMVTDSVQASVFDRTLALKVTGRWQGASSQANVGDTKMVEKDRTLMLCPIVTERTCPVVAGTLLETTGH